MKSKLSYIISGDGTVTGVLDNKPFTIPPDAANSKAIKDAIKRNHLKKLAELIDMPAHIKTLGKGKASIVNGEVQYNGVTIHNTLTARILTLMKEGYSVKPMFRFLENLMQNPDERAIERLYDFLEVGKLPITEDGYFLAFKRVDDNYKSIQVSPDGTYFDNRIGKTLKEPREVCNPDPNETCSRGLHFCSLGYLRFYGKNHNGSKTVIVKVNPKNVVAIPNDHQNTKARACEYKVVGEHLEGDQKTSFTKPLYSKKVGEFGKKPNGSRYWNVRDERGHFVKR